MDIQITPDQQAKLSQMAQAQGRSPELLVQEALERFLTYDDWFSREVAKGLSSANRGDFVEHHEVLSAIQKRYPV